LELAIDFLNDGLRLLQLARHVVWIHSILAKHARHLRISHQWDENERKPIKFRNKNTTKKGKQMSKKKKERKKTKKKKERKKGKERKEKRKKKKEKKKKKRKGTKKERKKKERRERSSTYQHRTSWCIQ
jgi:hypothetical protein